MAASLRMSFMEDRGPAWEPGPIGQGGFIALAEGGRGVSVSRVMVASPFPLRRLRCALLFLGLALALAKLSAGDWPCWREPSHTGISEANWQLKWPADGPRVAWKAKVGLGMSSFVVAGGRAYSLGHADGKDTLYCFEAATGRPV